MRFYGFALAVSALVLGACGGGDNASTDTAAATTDTAAAAPGAGTGGAAGAATAAAPTGTIHTVNMVGDANGYRFEPAELTIKPGDGVRYVMVSMGPHNVHFDTIPNEARAQLDANIPNKMGELMSAYLTNPNEEIVISYANLPPGRYAYVCDPHAAMGMRGAVTIQQ